MASYTIDIEPGLLTKTPTDGLPIVINGQQVVTEGGYRSVRKNATMVSVATPTGYVNVVRYFVILDLTNLRIEEIYMDEVTNQVTWTNDEAGVETAVEDIKEALTSGGGGGGGTVTDFSFNDDNGFAGSVTGSTTTPELTLTTTVGDTQVVVANGGALTGSAGLTYDGTILNATQAVQVNGDVLGDALIVNQDSNETFVIGPGGEMRVAGDPGTAGSVLTSAGPAAVPVWQEQPLRYVALVSQSGTDDPVATVLVNTLGGTVVWTRNNVGDYIATLVGAFPQASTVIDQPRFDLLNNVTFVQVNNPADDFFQVQTADLSGFPAVITAADSILNSTPFCVTVYP